MITFWDTSAVINAFINSEVYDRLAKGEHITCVQVLAEFFAIMTGRGILAHGIRWKLTANDASAWLDLFTQECSVGDLTGPETLEALRHAQALNVQGGRVYDYLHAESAKKSKADSFLTRNTSDFQGLTGRAALEWP
jgi:predicted nucleic acid-binding protein